MRSSGRTRKLFLPPLFGAVLGYLVLHPYSMMIYSMYGHQGTASEGIHHRRLLDEVAAAFDLNMLAMGLPFAFIGALAGLVLGFWLDARARRVEIEKRLLAVETLQQLMVTLAHHLLNAVQGIGGFASAILRKEHDEEKKRSLERIRQESARIEAVVKTLQSLESVTTERYTANSETLMIDITKELQNKIEALKAGKTDAPR